MLIRDNLIWDIEDAFKSESVLKHPNVGWNQVSIIVISVLNLASSFSEVPQYRL